MDETIIKIENAALKLKKFVIKPAKPANKKSFYWLYLVTSVYYLHITALLSRYKYA